VRIPADLPQRHGVNEVEMPSHQLGEGGLRPVAGVKTKQFGVCQHDVLTYRQSPPAGTHKKGPLSAALENVAEYSAQLVMSKVVLRSRMPS